MSQDVGKLRCGIAQILLYIVLTMWLDVRFYKLKNLLLSVKGNMIKYRSFEFGVSLENDHFQAFVALLRIKDPKKIVHQLSFILSL